MTYPLGGSSSTVSLDLVDTLTTVDVDTRSSWAGLFGAQSRTVSIELVDLLQVAVADVRSWAAIGCERNPTYPQLFKDWTTWPSAL